VLGACSRGCFCTAPRAAGVCRLIDSSAPPAAQPARLHACPTRVTRCTAAVSPRARADTIAAAAAAALCDHFTLTVTCSRPHAAALDACSLLLTMPLAGAVQAESVEYSQTPLGPDYEYPLQWRVHVGPGGEQPPQIVARPQNLI